MKNFQQKKSWYISGMVAIVILLSLILVYATNFSDPVTSTFQNIYPAVFVGYGYISVGNWKKNIELSKKLNPDASYEQIVTQLIKRKKLEELVDLNNVKYSNSVFDGEFKFYITGKNDEYTNLLKNYFSNDENLFKEYVVRPQVNLALLEIKYNDDYGVNNAAYSRAQNILAGLKNGTPFEQLAKSESDDKATGQIGGDLGFVTAGQLLPELEKVVMKAPIGSVNDSIVVSRLGYHILYPVETAEKDGQKIWHVRHILIKTTGFDNWVNPQLNHLWVWRIK